MPPLSHERTPCPHCGRETRTADDGVCVECWGVKSEDAPRKRRDPEPTQSRGGGGGSILDDLGCCWWPALGSLGILGAAIWLATSA